VESGVTRLSVGVSGKFHDEANVNAEARQHVNQAVRTEEIDPPSQQVAHARLCDAQDLGRLRLCEAQRGGRFLKLNQ
jgi:hypothetical protein